MWVQLHTQNNTEPSRLGEVMKPASSPDVMFKYGWRILPDDYKMPSPTEGFEIVAWLYEQDPENEKQAVIQLSVSSIAEREAKEAATLAAEKASSDAEKLADTELDIVKFEAEMVKLDSFRRQAAEVRWLINAAIRAKIG